MDFYKKNKFHKKEKLVPSFFGNVVIDRVCNFKQSLTDTCPSSRTISGNEIFLLIKYLTSFTLDAAFVRNSVTRNSKDIRGKQNLFKAFRSSEEIGNSSEIERYFL